MIDKKNEKFCLKGTWFGMQGFVEETITILVFFAFAMFSFWRHIF